MFADVRIPASAMGNAPAFPHPSDPEGWQRFPVNRARERRALLAQVQRAFKPQRGDARR
jgi:hypothetical protein